MNALIIDDEIDICYLLTTILRNANIDSTYVNTLDEAKGALHNKFPGIIFLDNHLPDGMGVDFISYIKKNKPECKVVMITAYDTQTDRLKATKAGADDFIAKPFTRQSIYGAVDKLVL
jgi:two-component system, OmpR family, response regulator